MFWSIPGHLKRPMLCLIRERALRGGSGGNLPSLWWLFFNIHVIDISTTYWHFTRRGHLACVLCILGQWLCTCQSTCANTKFLLPSVYTGYCSVLHVNWLLRVLYFAWLLIKGLSFDLVSHADVKRVHKTKWSERMQNRICSLWPTFYTEL